MTGNGAEIGLLLLSVVSESGFLAEAMLFAEPILRALAWPTGLTASVLAPRGSVGISGFAIRILRSSREALAPVQSSA